MFNRIAVLSVLVAAGCTDGGEGGGPERFEGIYTITAHTQNLDGCVPGATVDLGDRFAIAFQTSHALPAGLQVVSCASPDACLALRDQIERNDSWVSEFDFFASRPSGDTMVGGTISTGFNDGGTCRMAEVTKVVMQLDGDALTIRQEHTIAPDFPTQDGLCDTSQTEVEVEGQTCSQLDILTAQRVDSL